MINNECIILTIKIKDDLNSAINTLRNRGFQKTGNPSFKIFDNHLIIGAYSDTKLPSYIPTPKASIKINNRINLNNGILTFNSEDNFSLLQDKIINTEQVTLPFNKYFPLSQLISKNLTPSIFLAANITFSPFAYNLNKTYLIDDYKVELLKLKIENNSVVYSICDSRHLQSDIV